MVEPALTVPEGCEAVSAPVAGTVWKFQVGVGDEVAAGDPVLIVESMKMEISVVATSAGRVKELSAKEGAIVKPGQVLALVEVGTEAALV